MMICGQKQPWKTGKKMVISKACHSVLQLVDNAPGTTIKEQVSKADAEEMKKKLEELREALADRIPAPGRHLYD